MALEMIDSIRLAEKEASDIRNAARETAKTVVAKAHITAKANSDLAEKEAYRKASEIEAEAENEAKKISEADSLQLSEYISNAEKDAEKRLDTAADFILKELFKV